MLIRRCLIRRAALPGGLMLACAIGMASAPAVAQRVGQPAAADEGKAEEIVVTARQAGAPLWEMSIGPSTVLLVGEIDDVPKATPWRPTRLEAATGRARSVILGTRAKVSPGDLLRLLFTGARLRRLPRGRTTADYLSPRQQQRLIEIGHRTGANYANQSMLISAFELLSKELRFNRGTTDTATDVVRRAARRARIATEPVGTVRGEDLLDSLFGAAPETHVACLEAAMSAYEDGPEGVLRRGRDWTSLNVPAVMLSPLETALGRCWPWTDGAFGGEIRQQWVTAIRNAGARPGVTLAVVPLRVLAERGGVLDQLHARGIAIKGLAWHR